MTDRVDTGGERMLDPRGERMLDTGGERMLDVLIVAAFPPELAGLGPPEQIQAAVTVSAAIVGIGVPAAASGTAARLARVRPRGVVLVGTCGAYPESGLATGEPVVSGWVSLVDPAVALGLAALPEAVTARLEAHAGLRAALGASGARIAGVATTLGVTTDDALALRLGSQAAVEHMEAFAVATACADAQIPFCAVLGVANPVGSQGRSAWRAHHDEAGRAACAVVSRWLLAGAKGLP